MASGSVSLSTDDRGRSWYLEDLGSTNGSYINGRRVDVVTEGPFVERGSPLKVVEVEGARVVVRAL